MPQDPIFHALPAKGGLSGSLGWAQPAPSAAGWAHRDALLGPAATAVLQEVSGQFVTPVLMQAGFQELQHRHQLKNLSNVVFPAAPQGHEAHVGTQRSAGSNLLHPCCCTLSTAQQSPARWKPNTPKSHIWQGTGEKPVVPHGSRALHEEHGSLKCSRGTQKAEDKNTHLTSMARASLAGYTQLFLMEKGQIERHIFLIFIL